MRESSRVDACMAKVVFYTAMEQYVRLKIVSSLRRWDISLLTVLRVTFLDDGNWDMDMKHGGALFYWVDGEVDACEYDGERLCYVFEIIRVRAHTHIFLNSLIFDFILHYQATRA